MSRYIHPTPALHHHPRLTVSRLQLYLAVVLAVYGTAPPIHSQAHAGSNTHPHHSRATATGLKIARQQNPDLVM